MAEFTINRNDENVSEKDHCMYISFSEEPLENKHYVTCSGTALIIPDGKTKYLFLYQFLHSRDWQKILKLRITSKNYLFSKKQLRQFGLAIAFLINHFISENN